MWNNYIGRVATSRQEEKLEFAPEIKIRIGDPRLHNQQPAVKVEKADSESENEDDDIFAEIPDAEDGVPEYSFARIGQWMPLVHYDEIRERNAPTSGKSNAPSLPFFLDFRNLTEEKQKMREEARREALEAKARTSQQQDRHFKAQGGNEIELDGDSMEEDFVGALRRLSGLSIGEVDYQLRAFILRPGNA